MSYYIGIDGGGSKTKCVLCDESLNILFQTQSGPSNFLTIGTETVSETIINLISECCSQGKITSPQIEKIVLGTTGAGREADAKKLEEAVIFKSLASNLELKSFKVVSDARIALEGAFSGQPGSILIAGTGSIMFGKDKEGNIHRVGGCGRLIGDEGSGLTIGRKGLNLLAKYYDGRGKETSLKYKIENLLSISDQSELITKVYSDQFKIQDIAPLVIESAAEGDLLCKEILDDETNEILLHIMAMQNKLDDERMKVVFIGGTIANKNAYSDLLKGKINTFLPKTVIQQPEHSPEIGAIIIAKQNI